MTRGHARSEILALRHRPHANGMARKGNARYVCLRAPARYPHAPKFGLGAPGHLRDGQRVSKARHALVQLLHVGLDACPHPPRHHPAGRRCEQGFAHTQPHARARGSAAWRTPARRAERGRGGGATPHCLDSNANSCGTHTTAFGSHDSARAGAHGAAGAHRSAGQTHERRARAGHTHRPHTPFSWEPSAMPRPSRRRAWVPGPPPGQPMAAST